MRALPIGKQCGDPVYSWPSNLTLLIKIIILSSLEGSVAFSNSIKIKNSLEIGKSNILTRYCKYIKYCITYHY